MDVASMLYLNVWVFILSGFDHVTNISCLCQLTAVNDKMAEYTNTPGTASLNAALMHTLQRHRDILQVYSFTQSLSTSLYICCFL